MTFSHELKFQRAGTHLKEIEGFGNAWCGGNHHSIRSERDGNGDLTFLASADPVPLDFGLLIGECLHNLRSGLDNLAYSLAVAYTKPLPEDFAESSEFPIFGDRDKQGNVGVGAARFNETTQRGDPTRGSGLYKIRGWPRGAQAIVEGLQPYHRGNAFEQDPLWVLHELDRVNKHRLLHSCVAASEATTVDFGKSNVATITARVPGVLGAIQSLGGPIEADTPIFRLVRLDPQPRDRSKPMNMEIQPALHIAFASGTPVVELKPVYAALAAVHTYVIGTVLPALVPYL